MKPKYGIGDKVEIINYGHLIWYHKDEPQPNSFPLIAEEYPNFIYDTNPSLVGKQGLINAVSKGKYSIKGIGA